MKWWMIALPVGALGAYLLLRPSDEDQVATGARTEPPPPPAGPPVATAGGPRARRYGEQIDMALSGYLVARSVPFAGGVFEQGVVADQARKVAMQTINTVLEMAEKDVKQGGIAKADLDWLERKAEDARMKIFGAMA